MNRKFKNFNISNKLFWGFTLIFLILVLTIITSFSYSNKIIKSTQLISHTHEVIKELANIETLLIDLETSQRGYIITGKETYLETYNNSLKIFDDKISALRKLTIDNPSQTKRIGLLRRLTKSKLKDLQSTITLRKEVGFESAKKTIVDDSGKDIMDAIRALLSNIENEETRLLKTRNIEPNETKEKNNVALIALLVISTAASTLIGIAISRSITVPVNALIQGVKVIGKGDLKHNIRLDTNEEIGQLSHAFEEMINKLISNSASKDLLENEIEARKKTELELTSTKSRIELYARNLEQKNKESEEFVYIASHDLQEPLRTIKGFTELLKIENEEILNDESNSYLEFIAQSSNRMSELIKGLLDYGRIGQEKKQIKINCDEFIDSIQMDLGSIIDETGSTFIVEKLPIIRGYKTEIRLLFQNLITNAIKYHKTGIKPIIQISAKKKNDTWQFSFKDNGLGIADEHQERIFKLFQRLHNKSEYTGTGIGLAHCRKIVELHEGEIWVESKLGLGSTFHFTLKL